MTIILFNNKRNNIFEKLYVAIEFSQIYLKHHANMLSITLDAIYPALEEIR